MTRIGVWAPDAGSVEVVTDSARHRLAPDRERDGWWSGDIDVEPHGGGYAFSLDGSDPLPDPRSMWQPDGVHGNSRTYDHDRFSWSDQSWTGAAGPAVIYELHVGTFTPGGTFESAIERLDHLVDLGVTHVELLPVNGFDGPRGWGYDGVNLFAVHEPYGGPDGCKAFVDACHQRGLGVIFDVVYNHLGPSGNHLARFGPYFTDRYRTPWGDAVNLDGPGSDEVRSFVLDNVRSWIVDFHADGLRLDAVHELHDTRALPLLEEVAALGPELEESLGRPLLITAESDRNDPRFVIEPAAGGTGLDAAWNDDFHHSLHSLVTGEQHGYYVDFGAPSTLAKALTDVFVHDGSFSTFRERHHGRPVDASVPADRFVVSLQNHDQIGNRATGDRIGHTIDVATLQVGAALLLTSPFTPMLFMGEEWAASTPWPFFTSFPDPDLAEAVRSGRRAEFSSHGWSDEEIPDPQDAATFESAVLRWEELDQEPHREVLGWYRELISLRRRFPEIVGRRLTSEDVEADDVARTLVIRNRPLVTAVNLGTEPATVPLGPDTPSTVAMSNDRSIALDGGSDLTLPPGAVAVLAPG